VVRFTGSSCLVIRVQSIAETRESETIKLKVGRAVNLVKRIDQWGKQCGSKEQVLRGFYPGVVEPDNNAGDGGTSLMKGRVIAGEKGSWCHRLGGYHVYSMT
jgi:hypothetical protein